MTQNTLHRGSPQRQQRWPLVAPGGALGSIASSTSCDIVKLREVPNGSSLPSAVLQGRRGRGNDPGYGNNAGDVPMGDLQPSLRPPPANRARRGCSSTTKWRWVRISWLKI